MNSEGGFLKKDLDVVRTNVVGVFGSTFFDVYESISEGLWRSTTKGDVVLRGFAQANVLAARKTARQIGTSVNIARIQTIQAYVKLMRVCGVVRREKAGRGEDGQEINYYILGVREGRKEVRFMDLWMSSAIDYMYDMCMHMGYFYGCRKARNLLGKKGVRKATLLSKLPKDLQKDLLLHFIKQAVPELRLVRSLPPKVEISEPSTLDEACEAASDFAVDAYYLKKVPLRSKNKHLRYANDLSPTSLRSQLCEIDDKKIDHWTSVFFGPYTTGAYPLCAGSAYTPSSGGASYNREDSKETSSPIENMSNRKLFSSGVNPIGVELPGEPLIVYSSEREGGVEEQEDQTPEAERAGNKAEEHQNPHSEAPRELAKDRVARLAALVDAGKAKTAEARARKGAKKEAARAKIRTLHGKVPEERKVIVKSFKDEWARYYRACFPDPPDQWLAPEYTIANELAIAYPDPGDLLGLARFMNEQWDSINQRFFKGGASSPNLKIAFKNHAELIKDARIYQRYMEVRSKILQLRKEGETEVKAVLGWGTAKPAPDAKKESELTVLTAELGRLKDYLTKVKVKC